MTVNKHYFLSGLFYRHEIFTDVYSDFQGINLPELSEYHVDKIVDYYAENIQAGATVVAWSIAGIFAILLQEKFPQKIKQLILLATTPHFMSEKGWSGIHALELEALILLYKSSHKLFKKQFSWLTVYPCHDLRESVFPYIEDKDYYLAYAELLKKLDVRETFKKITGHSRVILGEKDALMKTASKDIEFLNSSLEITVLSNSGHALFLTEKAVLQQIFKKY